MNVTNWVKRKCMEIKTGREWKGKNGLGVDGSENKVKEK